ncbi:hypothetical protein ACO0LD_25370 [Undibacterium sp. Ji83W]|uniref:hypothetical protein n=1 Tax=Undibacterium sp. Ji83W TaxID=3413043 RepID=UPI003BF21566
MSAIIQAIFINPPMAIARLGGSSTPQEAFQWIQNPAPRANAETVIAPDWSLRILPDSSVEPFMPTELSLRDGELIRPVAPFFEIWAKMGEPGSAESSWTDAPLTPALLKRFKIPLANLTLEVNAQNHKAARRAANPLLRFGTNPPVVVAADNHANTPLLGVSPPAATAPMIPAGRNIPLGSIQFLLSKPQPATGQPWLAAVNVEVLRFRFTPARGRVYGPPDTSQDHPPPVGTPAPPVLEPFNFLNPDAGWRGITGTQAEVVSPWDTYDGADVGGGNISLGVVDDTCEARVKATLRFPGATGRTLNTTANVFVAPPDFAPDRRPFLSMADEINDRSGDMARRNAAMTTAERERWVEDLFERVYETLSLFNVDHYRDLRAMDLPANARLPRKITGDGMLEPLRAFGGRDPLRNQNFTIPNGNAADPLPLTTHARSRHRYLSDLQALHDFVQLHPTRLKELIRQSFHLRSPESADATSMQMPPLMRNSNAQPLTLSTWQYDLLLSWVDDIVQTPVAAPLGRSAIVANRANERRDEILAGMGTSTNPAGGQT